MAHDVRHCPHSSKTGVQTFAFLLAGVWHKNDNTGASQVIATMETLNAFVRELHAPGKVPFSLLLLTARRCICIPWQGACLNIGIMSSVQGWSRQACRALTCKATDCTEWLRSFDTAYCRIIGSGRLSQQSLVATLIRQGRDCKQ